MTRQEQKELRLATIAALVADAPLRLGRTALMKCLYLLQTLRGVPLGYRFSLYSYGPFDQEVLGDLAHAEADGRVKSRLVPFPNESYGYELAPAPRSARRLEAAAPYAEELEWVLGEFGSRSAGELEMASTIVYVDRSNAANGLRVPPDQLVDRVREIKPHLVVERIRAEAANLQDKGYLTAVC